VQSLIHCQFQVVPSLSFTTLSSLQQTRRKKMLLSCQKCFNLHLPCSSSPSFSNPTSTIIKCQNPNKQHPIVRTHNSKSPSFLLYHLSPKEKGNKNNHPSPAELQDPTPQIRKPQRAIPTFKPKSGFLLLLPPKISTHN